MEQPVWPISITSRSGVPGRNQSVTDPAVPYFDLKIQFQNLRNEILPALERVCESASFASGPEVKAFEEEYASFCEVGHCIGVNAGTSALHVALRCMDIGPGDEVITTPFTFIATAWAILYCGATPVFVDIHPATRNLDPAGLRAKITPRTRAILPVHLYGLPADMDAIHEIASDAGCKVVEDAAQAHGARYHGRRTGGLASMGCFSFYPGKNLGAYGEGGAVTTDDADLAARARALRDHAMRRRYHHDEVGYNYRMDGFQAAVLRVKLRHLPAWNRRRAEIALRYTEAWKDLPMQLPEIPGGRESAWHLYVVGVENRDRFCTILLQEYGIPTALHYPLCLHQQEALRDLGYASGDFPVAEALARRCVSLPFFPEMTDAQVDTVIQGVCRSLS